MKKAFFFYSFLWLAGVCSAQGSAWHQAGDRIKTPWADSVNPQHVLDEYPRPQLQRPHWTNLNGLWHYRVMATGDPAAVPSSFEGSILVPFAIESSLSGVGRTVGKDSVLWYERTVQLPARRSGQRLLLHFGAVDWRSDIYINGTKVATHEGGYDPFTVDITEALKKGSRQQLAVRVWDPTDDGPQPRGKQVRTPQGIWYTPVTGIWQTVWLEAVPGTYIASTRQTPDLDHHSLTVSAAVYHPQPGDEISVTVWRGAEKVAAKTSADTSITLSIPDAETWSPSHPFLYDLKMALVRKGKVVDEVTSYFAMRKIAVAPDSDGIQKMMLNNAFLFEFGPLDQGWWPDGLYTAPTDAALRFDIEQTKAMGFNMIRKHIKVEPARWYYYCDRLGMLVWQDMPSGDLGNHWENRPGVLGRATDRDRSAESERYYRREWEAIMNALHNFPSIIVWTPFNEAWGQFKTVEIARWTMSKDPSRLVNPASGGNFYNVGHLIDLHNYPDPAMPRPDVFGSSRALVLGEFGGLGLPLDGHTWQQKNWGYQSFHDQDSLLRRYESLIEKLQVLARAGLSAAVYTQTTDVEGEVNGFMTYDRKVMKMPLDKLKKLNTSVYQAAK